MKLTTIITKMKKEVIEYQAQIQRISKQNRQEGKMVKGTQTIKVDESETEKEEDNGNGQKEQEKENRRKKKEPEENKENEGRKDRNEARSCSTRSKNRLDGEDIRKKDNEEKDHRKLCKEYAWNKKCNRQDCKYTHKEICHQLRKKGICTEKRCREGHNIEIVCKYYNSVKGCWYNERRCRFLHLKIAKEEKLREKYKQMKTKVRQEGSQNEKSDSENENEYKVLDAYYDEDYKTGSEDGNGEVDQKMGKEREIERDNGHFLEVDRRHDIRKKINATKTEIKELEREIEENRKKEREREDQNQ